MGSLATGTLSERPQLYSVVGSDGVPGREAHHLGMCRQHSVTGEPRAVVVAVAYLSMRRMITELLERDQEPWLVTSTSIVDLARLIDRHYPDALIVDATDFPSCCGPECGGFPAAQVVVIGREPDHAYRAEAFRGGAGAWIAADAIGDELCARLHDGFGHGRAVTVDD